MIDPEKQPIKTPVTVFVCNNCGKNGEGAQLGRELGKALSGTEMVRVQPVKCMGGCNHPCAIALSAAGKLTYMYGDMNALPDTVAAIQKYAHQYGASPTGMVARGDKPAIFANVLVRIPPFEWQSDDGVVRLPAAEADMPAGAGVLRRADD